MTEDGGVHLWSRRQKRLNDAFPEIVLAVFAVDCGARLRRTVRVASTMRDNRLEALGAELEAKQRVI
ncbi:hypothetical protein AB0H37_24765 [Actinomadura sp. NPDC023710]|uniref:hypothetical protein n=1 Tax=Actinomadura sp. NPDC023710 TaxID=3158219 RepID=UPI00340D4354